MTSSITIPAAVLGLQGLLNTAFATYGILRPVESRAYLASQFGSSSLPAAAGHSLSVQLLSMGILTLFAAGERKLHRRALIARVVVHGLAGVLFWQDGESMRTAAVTDLSFGVINALAILFVR